MLTTAILSTLLAAAPAAPASPTSAPASTPLQAQVQEASALADGMKTAVGEFVNNHDRLPTSNEEAGLPAPALIHGRYAVNGTVSGSRIIFDFGPGADQSLVGKHLFFGADVKRDAAGLVSIMWACKSDDIPQDACPKSCACSG